MKKILPKLLIAFLIITDITLLLWILLHGKTIAIFQPAGVIAYEERNILVFIAMLGLSIVVPSVICAYIVFWKYKEDRHDSTYTPDWDENKPLQISLLLLICAVISVVAFFDWKSAHDLDPFKPIPAKNQLAIQVVAMRWKWLFIYPDQGIATVNYIRIPQNTAITFHITADAPMNGFWIPQLGGQVYAMNGMSMPFHVMATKMGKYTGKSTNISGDGFAGMTFTVESTSQEDFDAWVYQTQNSGKILNTKTYADLAKPSQENPPAFYTLDDKDLYNTIMMKYMSPTNTQAQHHH